MSAVQPGAANRRPGGLLVPAGAVAAALAMRRIASSLGVRATSQGSPQWTPEGALDNTRTVMRVDMWAAAQCSGDSVTGGEQRMADGYRLPTALKGASS